MSMKTYFLELERQVRTLYSVAEQAKKKNLDPKNVVEIPLATTLAERSIGLVSVKYPQLKSEKLSRRIGELEKKYGKLDPAVCLTIAEEIAKEKFCKFKDLLEAIDAGIRLAFAYYTLGVVVPPLEGFTHYELKKTKEGKDYFCVYFSGPIRAAGTTAGAFVLVIIDYLRNKFGYAKYDPTEIEIKREITEIYDYHERVTNLQYLASEKELQFLLEHLPLQIDGLPSEKREVSNYKDLERIEANRIRNGMCLVLSESVAQKAPKVLRFIKKLKEQGFELPDWDFLEEFVELKKRLDEKKKSEKATATYIKDLVAGRPVLGHPSRSGGFRLRYGRTRDSGFSAMAIHPATMAITDGFIATGTQIKIEKPTKGAALGVCDSILGPIVKLKNGSVRRIKTRDEAERIYGDVGEITYLGDLLVPYADFLNRNQKLEKAGYVSEWWNLQLKKAGGKVENPKKIKVEDAFILSETYEIPLHPRYIYFWSQISYEQFLAFLDWLSHSVAREEKIIFPYGKNDKERFQKGKRALEILGVEHEVVTENVVLNKRDSKALLANLGLKELDEKKIEEISKKIEKEDVLNLVNKFSKFEIKDKAGTFVGARMGRPEKAKLRKLTGSPHVLFPVGEEGGRFRSVQDACKVGHVKGEFPIYHCEKCDKETLYPVCEDCGEDTKQMRICPECKQKFKSEKCPKHAKAMPYNTRKIEIKHYLDSATKHLGFRRNELPPIIKGVRGTSSEEHTPENLAKGILRAKYNIHVNKDGTTRYDATELPITHFKPKEVGASVEKLKRIGYKKDIKGKELVSENQILELKPHDVILPACPTSDDEKADNVFLNVSQFIDEELVRLYKMQPFYNIKTREDLIGQLVVCMAPHNAAGVIGRIVGFSKVQALFASPYIHAGMRRDCVYPSTKFVYEQEGMVKHTKIGDFVERMIQKGNAVKKADSYGTLEVSIGDEELYAYGADPASKKLVKKKIKSFVKGKSPEKWIKIKTASGRTQVMTPRHKFVYLDGKNNFKVKKASEIKKGDKIALINKFFYGKNLKGLFLPELLLDSVPQEKLGEIRLTKGKKFFKKLTKKIGKKKLRKILKMKNFNNLDDWYGIVPLNHVKILFEEGYLKWEDVYSCKLRSIFNNKEWNLELKINKSLMRILGYYSSEGYCRQNNSVSQVCFRIMAKNQRKKLVSDIRNVFGIKPNLGEKKTKISICNKLVYYLFRYVFNAGSKAYSKKVPDFVFNVAKENVQEYISAYFDGDGSIIKKNNSIVFYSVSRELIQGVSLLLTRWGLFGRFLKTKKRLPGRKVLKRYKKIGKSPKKHVLHHLIYRGKDFFELARILNSNDSSKKNKLKKVKYRKIERKINFSHRYYELKEIEDIYVDIIKDVDEFRENVPSYCFEIENKSEEDKNVLWGEQILNARCDGDEAAVILLLDALINFSRKYLPGHRGATQDAPLVLNMRLNPGEVDDQIFDFDLSWELPLLLYESAEQGKHSTEIAKEMDLIKKRVDEEKEAFEDVGYDYKTSDINAGVLCSSYKKIPTMQEKVQRQMELVKKIRAVDTGDVARLIIERHFIRDIRGNLRRFSQQGFRCVKCNSKFRRPPLSGVCLKCGGKIIFTISEGGIIKYLEPALNLAEMFNVPDYVKQSLDLTKRYIESIFGKEKEKQEALEKWF